MPARRLFRLVQLINQQGKESDVLGVLTDPREESGITAAVMARYPDRDLNAQPQMWGAMVSADYLERYRSRRYDLDSPALRALNSTRRPVVWRTPQAGESTDSLAAEIQAGAIAEGLERGVLVPIWRDDALHGWVALALTEQALGRVDLFDMQLLALTAFYRIEELILSHAAPKASPVSLREREVLGLAAEGMSSKQIARALEISSRTVEFHFRNIADKLKTTNKTHSVAKALRLGLIRPNDASGQA